jgi:hypothetical protein
VLGESCGRWKDMSLNTFPQKIARKGTSFEHRVEYVPLRLEISKVQEEAQTCRKQMEK